MSKKPFWITSFEAELDIERRLAAAGEDCRTPEEVLTKLSALAAFLDRNDLSTRRLGNAQDRVDEDFVLTSGDLTPTGIMVMRKAYETWQRRAKSPADVRSLERALAQLRAAESNKGSKRLP